MPSLTNLAVLTATLATLTTAIPLARAPHKHAHLHAARAPAPLDLPAPPGVKLDLLTGTCGGSTGFGCAVGWCCSEYGYCGNTAEYCGGNSNETTDATPSAEPAPAEATHAVGAANKGPPADGWGSGPEDGGLPAYTPQQKPPPPPAYTSPAETMTSPAAAPEPTSTSEAPAAPPTAAPEPEPTSAAPASPPAYTSPPSSGSGSGLGNVYKMYSGNGAASSGWPSESQWASFDDLWADNVPTIKISCTQFGQENPSEQEIADTKNAINSVAGSTGVDARFILAIMMQESKGCVRVPTTSWSHANPGLFQSYMGKGTCNPDGTGVVPCPASMIKQMVEDGVAGTASGPGLKQNLAQCSAQGSQKYYEAARIYNAGSVPSDGNLGAPGATACYCSDVANRLTGWSTAESGCTLG